MRALLRAWLLCVLALAGVTAALAQGVQKVPPLNGRLEDRTGMLDAAARRALTARLEAIEKRSGSQVVVLMVPSTLPEDIAAYAQRVAAQWKIGRADVGDGLLIVVARDDRRMRIEVSKALEGAVPDLAAKRIIEQQMTPAFRNGDYAGGLNAAVDRLAVLIANEPMPAPSATGQMLSLDAAPWVPLGIFFFVGLPIVGGVFTSIVGRRLGALASGVAAAGFTWWLTHLVSWTAAAGILALLLVGVFGVGSGSWQRRRQSSAVWGRQTSGWSTGFGGGGFGGGGGGGGGGFSSGGGGDFGGGGASGRW